KAVRGRGTDEPGMRNSRDEAKAVSRENRARVGACTNPNEQRTRRVGDARHPSNRWGRGASALRHCVPRIRSSGGGERSGGEPEEKERAETRAQCALLRCARLLHRSPCAALQLKAICPSLESDKRRPPP